MNKGTLNCQESFMLALQTGLHKDLGAFHQTPPRETQRDLDYVERRVRAEGPEFLSKTLPQLAKSLDQSLLSGNFLCPTNFKRWRGTKLPCFMHGLFERVFDKDGKLLEDADAQVVKSIRQAGYLFYKYQLPYPDHLVSASIREYIDDDKSIEPLKADAEVQATTFYATEVVNEIFREYPKDLHTTSVAPRNGPGSVANGLKPWQRYRPSRYYKSLDRLIPYDRMYYISDRHLFDCWDEWWELGIGDQLVMARLIAVPKDSRGPRLISAEHSEHMTYQQALREHLTPWLEHHRLCGGQINFTDQSINGKLALEASRTGEYATLDLSKASDLLSLDLVSALFEETPIHDYLMGTRSGGTQTPHGNLIFRKFAPMGSALCFPIQAISFYSLIVGRMVATGEKLGVAARSVWVYGDDIIVPTWFAHEAMDCLEAVGLKVNQDKSCYTGDFRESCGVDAFRGVDVTPIKLKKIWNMRPDASDLVAWVTASNNFWLAGYWHTADVIRRKVDGVVATRPGWPKSLPLCTIDSPVIGWVTPSIKSVLLANRPRLRWSPSLQSWSMRTLCLGARPKRLLHDGWKRVLRHGWERTEPEMLLEPRVFPLWDREPLSSDAFVVRNTTEIKYSVVTEASM